MNYLMRAKIHTNTVEFSPPPKKRDMMKCNCGSKSTGWTTIACCNICGLPMLTEPQTAEQCHDPLTKDENV